MRNKIKYQGGITKYLCQKKANISKTAFNKNILLNIPDFANAPKINFEIISLSGSGAFEDQLLSIYSFIYYAGVPIKWTIYSDKSYSPAQIGIFKKKFPFAEVVDWDVYPFYINNSLVKDYLEVCPMAKKLNVILGHPYEHQTIYLDSDIVFYKNISVYLNSPFLQKGFWYAPDTLGEVAQYFSKKKDSIYPLNAGFLILNKHFDFNDVFTYLGSLNGEYDWFSEQSSFEYAFRKQGAGMLDPRQFVIDSSDQFDFATKYHPDDIAMRHYTSPVRHKMWQNGWKWHFRK